METRDEYVRQNVKEMTQGFETWRYSLCRES